MVCTGYEKMWFCSHTLPVWNGPCVKKRWAMRVLSAVPCSRSIWYRTRGGQMVLALLTLSSGCQKTLHKGAVKYVDYCPSMWVLQCQSMIFLFCHRCKCGCTYHSERKSGPLHPGLQLQPSGSWSNQNICCCLKFGLASVINSTDFWVQASSSQTHPQSASTKLPQGKCMHHK